MMTDEKVLALSGACVYTASPERKTGGFVLAIHGSGREATSYRDVPFYVRQRDLAVENGLAFASVSMGRDVWAKEKGLGLIESLYAFMRGRGFDARCVLFASSAGGTQMFRFAQLHPEATAALIGIFPVWDVESITLPSLQDAWGLTGDALYAALAPRNPARFPDSLPDVPIVVCQGLRDKAVSPQKNALALARVRRVSLHLTQDEHSTHAFSLYDTPLITQVLVQYERKVNALCL